MKTKKDIKYLMKLIIAYLGAIFFGLICYKKGFNKMISWVNKDI